MIESKRLHDGLMASLAATGREARKGFAFVERNWYITKRYWAWEAVWVTYNIVNALAVTFIASSAQIMSGNTLSKAFLDQFVVYLAIGTAVWTFISVVFDSVTETVTMERWEGTIEYTFMAPISRITHMFGTCTFALIHGFIMTALQLVVMGMFFHMDFTHANWPAVLLITLAGSLSLIGLGTIAAVLPLLFTERGAQMAYIIRGVLLLVSGVYYPISILPAWMRAFSVVSPVTYMLEGLRQSIQVGEGIPESWPNIWPLLISGLVLIPAGQWIFGTAERYAKRTGRLKRNG
jgi:ABC-2 type transport system permease protein